GGAGCGGGLGGGAVWAAACGERSRRGGEPMPSLPQNLLTAGLYVLWESRHSEDRRAVELLAERLPGFSDEQYAAASRLAAALDRTAYGLAAAWFAGRGKGRYPTVDELEERCPGFSGTAYAEAISNNILWARK